MSLENFLSYLQQILTMVNPHDAKSVALAREALTSTVALAMMSGKIDPMAHRVMVVAEDSFEYLVQNARDFAGILGEYASNKQKRRRLGMILGPHC